MKIWQFEEIFREDNRGIIMVTIKDLWALERDFVWLMRSFGIGYEQIAINLGYILG